MSFIFIFRTVALFEQQQQQQERQTDRQRQRDRDTQRDRRTDRERQRERWGRTPICMHGPQEKKERNKKTKNETEKKRSTLHFIGRQKLNLAYVRVLAGFAEHRTTMLLSFR